jgi:hypothetical protein
MRQHVYRTTWAPLATFGGEAPSPIVPNESGTWAFLASAVNDTHIYWTWMRLPDKLDEVKPEVTPRGEDRCRNNLRGPHSLAYQEGEPCDWCGAKPPLKAT